MSPSNNPGPPPVTRALSTVVQGRVAAENYATIQETLKDNRGAEMRAIQAMFGGDKELMNRFLAVAFSALASNSDLLQNATPMSIIQSIKDAAALGLEPTGMLGEGAIIRYNDHATFQPMWRGYLKRIRNSRKVQDLDVQIVYMNDEFDVRLGTDPSIHHIPKLFGEKDEDGTLIEERGGYRGAYAWALMPSGKYIIDWMPIAEIYEVRDHFSTGFRTKPASSPWSTAFGEMARKTVIKRLAKRLPGEAVDQLLLADAQADNAAAALHEATAEAQKGVSALRTMALKAVGQLPEGTATDETEQAQQTSETEQPEAAGQEPPAGGEPTAVATGDDGLCLAPSPYGDDQTCVLAPGHGGNHKAADKSTWN